MKMPGPIQHSAVRASYFQSVTSTRPTVCQHDPGRFLATLATRVWAPAVAGGDAKSRKMSTPVISGALYGPDGTRSREHVQGIGMAIIDIDNSKSIPTGDYHQNSDGSSSDRPILKKVRVDSPVSVSDAADMLWAGRAAGVVYSTLSHSPGWPKVRLALPLAREVPPGLWEVVADEILRRIGLSDRLDCIDLAHLRNVAAVSVLPTEPVAGPLIRHVHHGELLDVSWENLAGEAPLHQAEPEWAVRLFQDRIAAAAAIPDGHLAWLSDADPADLLKELGCLVYAERPWSGGTKRRTTCPWSREHSGGVDDDAGVVYYPVNGRPIWRCSHAGHLHLDESDLIRATGRP